MVNLRVAFITHLHSDHTLGYPDLIFSPWVLGRSAPLEVYGPAGLRDMTSHIESAWKKDIAVRTQGLEQANSTGYRVNVHEIKPGVVYKDSNVTVKAFLVKHGTWDQAFGYRFETLDRTIVISGDTVPTDAVVEACNGCDILLHEVYSPAGAQTQEPHWKAYFATFHTSPEELARIAIRAHPGLLVLYHQVFHGTPEQELLDSVSRNYKGKVVSARDLDIY